MHGMTLLEAVIAWEKDRAVLEIAREKERDARAAIVELHFAERAEGTNSLPLDDGRVLKCVAKTDYQVDKDKVDAAIAKLRATGNEGAFIADRLFSWKPAVVVAELRRLAPAYRRIADRAIVPRPATPTLEVLTPKA